jgi:MFS family permease
MATGEQTLKLGSAVFAFRINLFAISLAALWIPLNLVVLPGQVDELLPESLRGTGIGAITFIGVGIAALVQPIAGRVTDLSPTADRRRPFMTGPAVAMVLLLFALALAPVYVILVVVYVALQVTSNFAQAALQALIPDLVDEPERGLASGIKTALDALGIVLGLGGVALLLSLGADSFVLIAFLAVVVALGGVAALLLVPRVEPLPEGERAEGFGELFAWSVVKQPFLDLNDADAAFRQAVLMRFLFLVGLFIVQRFLLFYLDERFGVERPEEQSSLYLLGGFAVAALGAGSAGWLSDLFGRATVLRASIVLASAMLVVLAVAPVLAVATIAGVGIALAAGAFQAANWALLSDVMERQKGGQFYGLANLATAGAGACAGIFGPIVDLFNAFSPALTYGVLFAIAAVLTLSSIFLTSKANDESRAAAT